VQVDKGQCTSVRLYTLHPATAQFLAERFGDDEPLRRLSHLRIGEYLEARAATLPYIEIALEAGHHLFQGGEYDRSFELLGLASDWLRDRGRVRKGLQVLEPFLEESARAAMDAGCLGRLLGTVGLAYHRLGEAKRPSDTASNACLFTARSGTEGAREPTSPTWARPTPTWARSRKASATTSNTW
jgi:hypothetical protein